MKVGPAPTVETQDPDFPKNGLIPSRRSGLLVPAQVPKSQLQRQQTGHARMVSAVKRSNEERKKVSPHPIEKAAAAAQQGSPKPRIQHSAVESQETRRGGIMIELQKKNSKQSLTEEQQKKQGRRMKLIQQRRKSIDQYVRQHPRGAIGQILVVKLKGGGYNVVDQGEQVALGCLAQATGDALISVMLGESQVQDIGVTKFECFALLILPPVVAGVVYGLLPLECPGLGVLESGFAAVSFLPPFVAAPGLAYLMVQALGVHQNNRANKGIIIFTVVLSVLFSVATIILGSQWMFPIPFGFIVCASPSFGAATAVLFVVIFGKTINKTLIKKLLPLIGVSLLPIFFSATFGFYRTLFSQVGALEQALLAPFWVFIKIALKKLATFLVDLGCNPDVAPYLMFCFDAVSAMAGNFLFLSTSSIWVVFIMIFIDVVENFIVGLRVVYLVLKSRSLAPEDDDDGRTSTGDCHSAQHDVLEAVERSTFLFRAEKTFFGVFEYMEPRQYKAVPVELMDDIDRYGQMNICLARAARLLLAFAASETSEMVTSCWAIIMLPFYYYGPNTAYMYTVDDFTNDDFNNALTYSLLDFSLELITFTIMVKIFHHFLKVKVFGVLHTYLTRKNLFLPILTIGCTITIASFTFFLKHFGMDPTFTWEEYKAIGNETASGC